MQHAALTRTTAFDFHAFLAGAKALRSTEDTWGGHRTLVPEAPTSATHSSHALPASSLWLFELHMAATRRWLAAMPARDEEVATSLRSLAAILCASHPLHASEVLSAVNEGAGFDALRRLLDRVGAALGTVRN